MCPTSLILLLKWPLCAIRACFLILLLVQVILAEDTLRQGGHLVAIKIMKRQYSYAGQKVSIVFATKYQYLLKGQLSSAAARMILSTDFKHSICIFWAAAVKTLGQGQ